MHDAVYSNDCASAQTESTPNLAEARNFARQHSNSLPLLAEHRNIISSAWIRHISKQQMPPRYMRVLNAIFSQTIDFQKREDDMSGLRLQQLTCIRADHANDTIKALEQDHAVIMHKGSYGQWLSINFDFASWGKNNNIPVRKYNNDPRCLLPEKYREPVDTGNLIGYNIDATPTQTSQTNSIDAAPTYTNQTNPEETPNTYTETNTDKNTESVLNEVCTDKNTESALNQVLDKLLNLEQKMQNLEQSVQPINTQQNSDTNVKNTPDAEQYNTANNVKNSPNAEHYNTANNVKNIPDAEQYNTANNIKNISNAEQSSTDSNVKNIPDADNTNVNNTHESEIEHHSNTAKLASSNTEKNPQIPAKNQLAQMIEKLHYPADMDNKTKQKLTELLMPTGDKAQPILNLLLKRLQNTHDPVKSVSAYLNGLVKRHKKGSLELNDTSDIATTTPTPQLTQNEHDLAELKAIYQDAYLDRQHIQRNINALREQQSFDEYLNDRPAEQKLWYSVNQTLQNAQDALQHAMLE